MKTVDIKASGDYTVYIGSGLTDKIPDYIKQLEKVTRICIVSDDNVFPLYGKKLEQQLENDGFEVFCFVFEHGERSKSLETYGRLLEYLCGHGLTRSDLIVALGGGVTGDLAGFAAATYQRGIRYIQIPTTLLAAVDSSVGGKTAVDLQTGKNQVGCFYQPSLVLCDPDTLSSLPEEEYKCGCAEVIKYAILRSRTFFDSLKKTPVSLQAEHVIYTCVGMKRDYVQEDEFDTGSRMFLNLGHSVGHAVETLSGFTILHGQAVAIGMAAITRAALRNGFCNKNTYDDVLSILEQYGLPTANPFPSEDVVKVMLSDKKLTGKTIRLIVPEQIGRCRILPVDTDKLSDWV